jgi:hypothetical protein
LFWHSVKEWLIVILPHASLEYTPIIDSNHSFIVLISTTTVTKNNNK